MCYTSIIYGENKQDAKTLLLASLNEYLKSNPHGYAIRAFPEKKAYREMNEARFVEKCIEIESEIIHLHLRFSTNVITEDYIHLWRGSNFTFGHNGVLQNIDHKNDSLGWMLENQKAIEKKNIEALKKSVSEIEGYGVFTILYDDGSSMFISANKSLKITKYGNSIMFSSDKLSLTENKFEYKDKRKINFKGFIFEKVFINTIQLYFKEKLTGEIENSIILVDKQGNLLSHHKVNVRPKTYGYWWKNNQLQRIGDIVDQAYDRSNLFEDNNKINNIY